MSYCSNEINTRLQYVKLDKVIDIRFYGSVICHSNVVHLHLIIKHNVRCVHAAAAMMNIMCLCWADNIHYVSVLGR